MGQKIKKCIKNTFYMNENKNITCQKSWNMVELELRVKFIGVKHLYCKIKRKFLINNLTFYLKTLENGVFEKALGKI